MQVLCSLHLLASGSYDSVIAAAGDVSQNALFRIFRHFLNVTLGKINDHIFFPNSKQDIQQIKVHFYGTEHFPLVTGGIDGTHVVKCPRSANVYFETIKILTL